MRKKAYIFTLLSLFLPLYLWSFDLSLAGIYQYSPEGVEFKEIDITRDLFGNIREDDLNGVLDLVLVRDTFVPRSILDASALSETDNIDFLLYGFLKVSGNYYDFEVKLYDREAGKIKKIFYAKNSSSEYVGLIQTMSERIITWFYKTLGVTLSGDGEKKEYGVVDIEFGAGYWIPLKPWSDTLSGLVTINTAVGFTPVNPLFRWDIFTFALSYGISLDYSLGMNRDGYESYTFHSGRAGFPLNLSARWHRVNRIIFSIVPELQMDFLLQDRLYWSRVSKTSTAFSLSERLGYEYIFPGNCNSLGISFDFHTAFYTDILFSADSSLYYRYTFNSNRKGDKDE